MPITCKMAQAFGGNSNPNYAQTGLWGHPGVDEHCGYGTPVHSLYDGLATLVWQPYYAADGFTAVNILVDDGIESFEWQVGHLTPAVQEGQSVHKGDLIGYEANHGPVYSGNRLITIAEQKAGNQEGAHRHYQKRPCRPVMPSTSYLIQKSNGGPYRDPGGFYYQYCYPNNGYNGCTDPLLPTFNRYLIFGMSGYDVFVLQRILTRKGFLPAGYATGFFGVQTWRALMSYQAAVGISPSGTVGPLTRAYLQKQLMPPPALSIQ